MIYERVKQVREFRQASKAESTRKFADRPTEFKQNAQPATPYLIVPRVSSENRRYVPIGYIQPDVIATDATQIVPNASLYEFGIITSNVHMAWMRTVAGKLKS
ncbi:type IIL restriction-modification enzyme MmeI, partial [Streptococcus suis]